MNDGYPALDKLRLAKKPNFKTLCLEYYQAKEDENLEIIEEIEIGHPLIKEAYNKIGFEKIKALKFVQKDIQNQLIVTSKSRTSEASIITLLNYKIGQLLDKSEVKNTLQNIYNMLEIKKLAKASDLSQWYTIKDHSKKIKGVPVTKLKIISCNVKV